MSEKEEKKDKLWFVKDIAEVAIGSGVAIVVANLVKATTPEDAKRLDRLMISIGGWSLGGLLGKMAADRIVRQAELFVAKLEEEIAKAREVASNTIVVVEKPEAA